MDDLWQIQSIVKHVNDDAVYGRKTKGGGEGLLEDNSASLVKY